MLKVKKPILKIHSWGGLGSQLQALSFYMLVQAKFPTRKIELVLHSSGITKRESEINFLKGQINIRTVEDYIDNQTNSTDDLLHLRFIKYFQKPMHSLLNFCKVVISDEKNVMKIMPWTTDIRCTYSKINLNSEFIKRLGLLLGFNFIQVDKNIIGVHYRAGDLFTSKRDALIPLKIIVNQIENLNEGQIRPKKVLFFSDSDLDLVYLENNLNSEFEFRSTDTLNTIFELLSSNVFIGTNSKVSLWVAIFKYGFKIPGIILLPNTMLPNFFSLINPFEHVEDFIIDSYSY